LCFKMYVGPSRLSNDKFLPRQCDGGEGNCDRKLAVYGSPGACVSGVPSIESYFSMMHADIPKRKVSPGLSIMTQRDDMSFIYSYDQMALKNPKIFLEKIRLCQIILDLGEEKRLVDMANSQISDCGDVSRIVMCIGAQSKMTVVPIALAVPEVLYVCEAQVTEIVASKDIEIVEECDKRLTIVDTAVGQAFFYEELAVLEKVDDFVVVKETKESDIFSIVCSQRRFDKSLAAFVGKKVAPQMTLETYDRIRRDLKVGEFSTRVGYNFVSEKRSLVDDQQFRQKYLGCSAQNQRLSQAKYTEREDVLTLACFKAHVASAQISDVSYQDLCPPFMIEFGFVGVDIGILKFYDLTLSRSFITICHVNDDTRILDLIDIVALNYSPQTRFWSPTHILHEVNDLPRDRDIKLCEIVSHEDLDGDDDMTEEYNRQQWCLAQKIEMEYVYESPLLHRRHCAKLKSVQSQFVVHSEKRIIEFELDPDRLHGLWSMLLLDDSDDDFDFIPNCDVHAELKDAQAHYQALYCELGLGLEYLSDQYAFDPQGDNHRFWYNADPKKYCEFDEDENFIWYKFKWMEK